MVNYGDQIMLQNAYNNWSGGFLDTCGAATCGTDLYGVFTAPSGPSPRGAGTNTALWKILDASGNATGQPVRYGDQILLQNAYNNWSGGFLDTCGAATCGTDLYGVFTAPSGPSPRGAGTNTALWKILDASGNATGQPVRYGDQILLQNAYNNWSGGFLDTCGAATCGTDLYGVFTAPSGPSPRGAGTNTALWKILDASGNATGQPVNPGDSVVLQNAYNNWSGGFLDTCGAATCGTDLYGVFTAPSAPAPRGAGTNTALWRILR